MLCLLTMDTYKSSVTHVCMVNVKCYTHYNVMLFFFFLFEKKNGSHYLY